MNNNMISIMNDWKSIKKEHPTDGQRVLIWNERDLCPTIQVWNEEYLCWDTEDGDDFQYAMDDHEYWMELPEKPVVKQQDTDMSVDHKQIVKDLQEYLVDATIKFLTAHPDPDVQEVCFTMDSVQASVKERQWSTVTDSHIELYEYRDMGRIPLADYC